jgi:hypothetical protein
MYSNRALLFIAAVVTLSLLTTSTALTTPAMASNKGGGSVVQEQVNTGNSNLDKEINKFYNCISKTHQDPPSINKVDDCYYQALGGSGSSGGGSTSNSGAMGTGTSPTSSIHHHKHGKSVVTGTGTLILPTSAFTIHHHKK